MNKCKEAFEKWFATYFNAPSGSVTYVDTKTAFEAGWNADKWSLFDHEKLLNLLNAVGHVGVDFGYGEYQLSKEEIETAQELYHEIKELTHWQPITPPENVSA